MPIEPRKQRTRQHIIADLSVHHVEGFILEEGHSVQKFTSDYSYDLIMRTFDDRVYVEPGVVYFQLKASESLHTVGPFYVFDLDIRDYNLWIREGAPVVLILFDALRRKAYWLAVQRYFQDHSARKPAKGARTVRVRIPKSQVTNRSAIKKMRQLRAEALEPKLRVFNETH